MSKREPHLYLQDILNSVNKIEKYIEGITIEEFNKDEEKIDAVVRNKVLHEYFGVDEEILWQTVTEDLPFLKEQLQRLPKA